MGKIFTKEFEDIDVNEIVKSIKQKGYFDYRNALNKEFIRQIEIDSTSSRLNLNQNEITGVFANSQYYYCNLLAKSKYF